jgi:hypothetical protein
VEKLAKDSKAKREDSEPQSTSEVSSSDEESQDSSSDVSNSNSSIYRSDDDFSGTEVSSQSDSGDSSESDDSLSLNQRITRKRARTNYEGISDSDSSLSSINQSRPRHVSKYRKIGDRVLRSAKKEVDTKLQNNPTPIEQEVRKKLLRGSFMKRMKSIDLPPKSLYPNGNEKCEYCNRFGTQEDLVICDQCEKAFHLSCLEPPLSEPPNFEWNCVQCIKSFGNDFGFEDRSEKRTWPEFESYACEFKKKYFEERNITNPTARQVEEEYWKAVCCPYNNVKVEYGADLHTSLVGR